MTCQCSLSDLLQRSIELIDPPSRNPPNECDGDYSIAELGSPDRAAAAASVDIPIQVADADATQPGVVDDPYPEHHPHPTKSTIPLHESTVKKKVRFSKSCLAEASKKVPISSIDAIRAFQLLMHAVSSIVLLVPSSPKQNCMTCSHFNDNSENSTITCIDISSSWETLSDAADIYRALLVTSCLLLELLPSAEQDDTSSASTCRENDTPNSNAETRYPLDSCNTTFKQNNVCPLQHSNNHPEQFIPTLTPSTINDILSTSRWCIHQLQLMERICAIKMILEHRSHSQNNSSSSTTSTSNIASLNDGGDDIHDYDRPISDWHANYDWHDDGFLPLPLFYHTDQRDNIKEGASNIISGHSSQKQDDPSKSNILFECCYLPQYTTDPPSSRFEKIAWTRDWIRGERLVSLRMEDYQYCDEMCSFSWDGVDDLDCSDANSETGIYLDGGDGTLDEENVSLDMSSAVLAEEESCLIDVMIVGEVSLSKSAHNRDKKKRAGNIKELRKMKRLKLKQKKELAEKRDLATVFIDQNLRSQSIRGKEGFLLLVREETMGSLLPHLFVDKGVKTIRVFVKLHPSGWLSLEDRSIRRQNCTGDVMMMQLRPLVPRVRYFDLFVCPKTTSCQPWVRNGATSFQFQVKDLLFLRSSSSSSLSPHSQSSVDENALEKVDLLFSVDEGTGGDFADGFEWVNCMSDEPME